ncbi:MAG: hypothetical protein KC656_27065 [Myxococcales bacterium]|nr:hypothetical protein [Myxococcales bacterium]MCB9664032.1 hypothetical protein [Alphaproteobacteria bacterium]
MRHLQAVCIHQRAGVQVRLGHTQPCPLCLGRGLHLDPGHAHVSTQGTLPLLTSRAARRDWEGWWGEIARPHDTSSHEALGRTPHRAGLGDVPTERGWRHGARRDLAHLLPALARG